MFMVGMAGNNSKPQREFRDAGIGNQQRPCDRGICIAEEEEEEEEEVDK